MANDEALLKKLTERAEEVGLLTSLSELETPTLNLNDKLVNIVRDVVRKTNITLFGEKDIEFLHNLNGGEFFDLQIFLCNLIPHLDISHTELMPLIVALVKQGGEDLAANQPYIAFKEWCSSDRNRSKAVVADAKKGNEHAEELICFALEASKDVKAAITILSESENTKLLIGSATAIGRIKMPNKLAQAAASELTRLACEHAEQDVRNNAMFAVIALLEKHAKLGREYGRKALLKAAKDPSPETLHVIASVLWMNGASLPTDELEIALGALISVDPDHGGTLSRIDMATTELIKVGRFKQISNFIKSYIARIENRNGLEIFHRLRSEIIDDNQKFKKLLVDWFLDGETYSCASLSAVVSRVIDKPLIFALTKADLPNDAEMQLTLCRRVVGHLFLHPVTAASVLVSALKKGDLSITAEIKEILFDPLLISYGGELPDYLKRAGSGKKVRGKDSINEVLDWHVNMLEGFQGIETLTELRPSERQRQFERVRSARNMENIFQKAMEQSTLLSLVSTQTILYGKNSSSYVANPNGNLRKVDINMSEHSVVTDYPRLQIIDPHGLDFNLLQLMRGRGFRK